LLNKFVSLDNQVIAVGRNEQKLQELSKKDERIIPFACDISQTDDLDKLILFVEQKHPDTNILINNAGIQHNYHFCRRASAISKNRAGNQRQFFGTPKTHCPNVAFA
jgi:Short-chain dehydrogenase involved in D-alanine esterification of lipoteichoic acid and wall teichoic acid (D-alanine transfer protein)